MDFFGVERGTIRSNALNKIAALSLSVEPVFGEPAISGNALKLIRTIKQADISTAPITHKELEILFALANASPSVRTEEQASALLTALSPYLLESTGQKFKSHLSLQLSPSPWDHLTKTLSDSILALSGKFPSLRKQVELLLKTYLAKFKTADEKPLSAYFSLLGYIRSLIASDANLLNSGIVEDVITLFNADFLDTIESVTQRALEEEHDFTYLLTYHASGDEFNSLLFAKLIQQLFVQMLQTIVCDSLPSVNEEFKCLSLSERLLQLTASDYDDEPASLSRLDSVKAVLISNLPLLEKLVAKSKVQVDELDNGSPYINLSSPERIDLALQAKGLALEVLAAGVLVHLVSKDYVSALVTSSLVHPTESVDPRTAPVVIAIASLLGYTDKKNISGEMIHIFPLIVSKVPVSDSTFIQQISRNLGLGLKPLDQDSIITTIYSLVNLLVSNNTSAPVAALRELKIRSTTNTFNGVTRPLRSNTINSLRQTESRSTAAEEIESDHVFTNTITAIVELTKTYNDDAISVLAVSVLAQKFQYTASTLDYNLLKGLADIAPFLSEKEFLSLMRLYDDALVRGKKDPAFTKAIISARVVIAKRLENKLDHPLYFVYLIEMLNNAVSRGDVQTTDHRSQGEISEIAIQISSLIKPLAQLLPKDVKLQGADEATLSLFQNFWFNLVVHGYNETSELTKRYQHELEVIALNSPPLASELQKSRGETSFELNTVLRRGSSNHNVKDQKHIIGGVSNSNSLEIRALSYSKLMFLSATSLLENLRVNVGDCSSVLFYFSDPSIAKANIEKFVGSIALSSVQKYTKLTQDGNNRYFTSDKVAEQLTRALILCCHRDYSIQDAAFQSVTVLVSRLPSSLCHQSSLYTLLDMLTSMFDSVVDSERSKYQPRRDFVLKHSKAKITVSDSIKWKRSTLEKLHKKAKEWCMLALNRCNQDMKALLQSYISDLGFPGKVNEVQFGVTFAMEMAGSILPGDLDNSNISVTGLAKANSIAGFLSEYGWRAKRSSATSPVDGKPEEPLITLISAQRRLLSDGSGSRGVSKEWQSYLLLSEIVTQWEKSIKHGKGLFSRELDLIDEGFLKMTYKPSDKQKINYYANKVSERFDTDLQVIQFFTSHFQGTMYQSEHLFKLFRRVVFLGLNRSKSASLHPYARLVRFELIKLGFDVLQVQLRSNQRVAAALASHLLQSILSWFEQNRQYPYGDNDLRIMSDLNLLINIYSKVKKLSISTLPHLGIHGKRDLALVFLHDEISKIIIWLNPLEPLDFKEECSKADGALVRLAYDYKPQLAFALIERYPYLDKYLLALVSSEPLKALPFYQAIKYFLASPRNFKYLILAKPVHPTESINWFKPPIIHDPHFVQYNMRALEVQDINSTFFYVPQIVQCLLHDSLGYVARFIVEVGKVSQKFSHQLIWNLMANLENEELRAQDMIDQIIASYDSDAMTYYKTEFGFFEEVTGISGKLRAYLKSTKTEKKIKIDEEMAKIVVAKNVYLPSNPDGVLVDINRTSGKPLQSHAKTPFMATFRIRKEEEIDGQTITVDKWQSAIFKVGDDVRQDVLALQLIAIFKSIWENAGLDLYCFPNRVTATAPGCGVIDVLPNSISRDMLGREAVNDLYTWFKAKFPDGELEYEDAVQNFVKSLAAYSIISYLLQFKDRHNGNIMYDDRGHILHIDFGFCFDIVPGGVRFEACPFKLTKEMVRVMGGSNHTESFRMFEELFIKGFLAVRPHYSLILDNVETMIASGLPCFKGDRTIKNLRARFFLDKDDKQCIKALKHLIRESYESMFSLGYDKFQKMTNGIPY